MPDDPVDEGDEEDEKKASPCREKKGFREVLKVQGLGGFEGFMGLGV